MAVCGGCGAETTRIRTTYHENHGKLSGATDECDKCNPNSFDPQWLTARGAMAWEAYPNKYDKIVNDDGSICYRAKPEWTQDTIDKMQRAPADEVAVARKAAEHRRRNGRKTPLSLSEIERIKARVSGPIREIQEARERERLEQARH